MGADRPGSPAERGMPAERAEDVLAAGSPARPRSAGVTSHGTSPGPRPRRSRVDPGWFGASGPDPSWHGACSERASTGR